MKLHEHARHLRIKTEFLFDVTQVPSNTNRGRHSHLCLLPLWWRTFLEDWFGLVRRSSQQIRTAISRSAEPRRSCQIKYVHHDDPLQIVVHRARMEISTQVNQVFETIQMNSSNVSTSAECLPGVTCHSSV